MNQKLNKLAEALYGTDEEIMALSTEEALELCGRDKEWLENKKRELMKQIMMKCIF